ncbi:chitobiase/beta-hexosaminidase C-terminal domain-containing protein [Methanosphaera sp. BMS]|uniref:chitobiase/beta-hexosaminidase C-terminal domain-containing protein n=1 Tax=Methanosphaera sp. BMS TaxID=1789762 RepID=UPI000DC1E71A|nr:chitobiase/beta-hexosaminidase C-terminal domain-containing protein [Methanosphaera sp. BMS]AWX31629.1 hypothetical protein AW729_00375 [Methanosphaera sp. BMS]
MDVSQSNDNDMGTTANANYDNNVKQDMDKYMNNVEVIPDNNFEDGFENSEIIELNDTSDEDEEEFVEDDKSTDSTRGTPNNDRGSGDTDAIVSNTTTALSVKVVLSKLTSTTYNATFSGVNNCSVYYTLNGANPTTSSTKYTKAFVYDTSKTLKYFAVKANGECGAVLSMKLSEGSTPYIVYKTPITNQAQQVYISYTLPTTSIYYTINGSIPTTKSTKYNAPININNYTDLRFISVYGSITSNVYSYRMNAVKPVVTIKNITDVRDNYQNITVKINKAGTIYYTRNGSTPNTSSNTWTNNTKVMISIKTQVRAILVDNEGFTSDVTFYQPPKVMTPPITAIRPLTTLENNKQRIQFSINKLNCTVYYTTDGTNPNNSTTVKTAKNNDKIYLNKNTRLKYYTQDDIQLYKSKVFNYTPVQHPDERPTITVMNASNIWSNGQQKIIIQSNQPGKFNITKYNQTQAPTETLNNYGSYTTDTNTKIEIYTQYNDKYSKTIEYNPINGSKTVMNYQYVVRFLNVSQYEEISFTSVSEKTYTYHMYNPNLNNYVFFSFKNETVSHSDLNIVNQEGIVIHKSDTLDITFYEKVYGEMDYVNLVYKSLVRKYERIYLYSNYTLQCFIDLKKKLCSNGSIETTFKTNSNIIIKNETLTFKPRDVDGCGQYDILQTFLITNEIITISTLNQSISNIEELYENLSISIITPQYRTILEAMTTITLTHKNAEYISKKLNSTCILTNEVLCMAGIENDRMNYIHFTDPLLGMSIDDTSNLKLFNMELSLHSYEHAKFSLDNIRYNCASTAIEELFGILNIDSNIKYSFNNITKIISIISNRTNNISITYDLNHSIIWSVMLVNGFEYIGSITDKMDDSENYRNYGKNMLKSTVYVCFEDGLCFGYTDKTKNLLGYDIDSSEAIIEDEMGSLAIDGSRGLFGSSIIDGDAGVITGCIMFIVGTGLIIDANGWLADTTNITRLFNTVLSLTLSYLPQTAISKHVINSFKLAKATKVLDKPGKIEYATKVMINIYDKLQEELLTFVENQIKTQEAREYILPYINGSRNIMEWF